MNYISIENLKVFAHHGVFPEETKHGQDLTYIGNKQNYNIDKVKL